MGALVILGLAVSGCASIIEGRSQQIVVNTNPAGADCGLYRQTIRLGIVQNAPGSILIEKTKHDIWLACVKPGYQMATYLNYSGVAGATLGKYHCRRWNRVGDRQRFWRRQQIHLAGQHDLDSECLGAATRTNDIDFDICGCDAGCDVTRTWCSIAAACRIATSASCARCCSDGLWPRAMEGANRPDRRQVCRELFQIRAGLLVRYCR